MQYLGQKRGQLGLRHTAAQRGLRRARFAQALEKRVTESVDVIRHSTASHLLRAGVDINTVRISADRDR